jgi:hypothetical protein
MTLETRKRRHAHRGRKSLGEVAQGKAVSPSPDNKKIVDVPRQSLPIGGSSPGQ